MGRYRGITKDNITTYVRQVRWNGVNIFYLFKVGPSGVLW